MQRKYLLIISSLVAAAAVVLGLWFLLSPKPSHSNFVHFDNQRKILDKSIESYNYMLEDFSADYLNQYLEKRSDQDKKIVFDQGIVRFKQEAELGRDRLKQMKSSQSNSNDTVKTKFDAFQKNYESALNYYDARLTSSAYITSTVNGSCAELSKQNFGKSSFPQAYVKAADTCLADIAEAKKKVTQKPALTLLSNVQKLVRERRDKFNEVQDDSFEANVAKINGLLLLLDINTQVEQYETQYVADTKAEYNALASKVNNSVTELKEITQKQMSVTIPQTNGKEQ